MYVRISRLKDGLGRAAGALLVARHHREDCEALDTLLQEWDGVYSALWRKRIARHVDGCEVCGSSRKAAAGALFGVAGLAPVLLLPDLKRRCLDEVGTPELVPVSFDAGWPVAEPWERSRRRRLAVPLVAAAALLAFAVGGLALKDDPAGGTPAAAATGVPLASAVTSPAGTVPPRASATPARTTRSAPSTRSAPPAASGSATFAGSGSATVSPSSSVSGPGITDTVTVVATVTDELGRTARATRSFTVTLAPC